jgi:hypothetical protein
MGDIVAIADIVAIVCFVSNHPLENHPLLQLNNLRELQFGELSAL